jgi:hypothetical protein
MNPQLEKLSLELCPGQILASLLKITFLKFRSDKLPVQRKRSDTLASNARKWRENQIAGIAPKLNRSLNDIKLQWANVLFVFVIASAISVKNAPLVNGHPNRRRDLLPP